MAEQNAEFGETRIRELLERAFAGDEDAFAEFYSMVMPIVENSIRKRARSLGKHDLDYQTIEDIRQATFMRFWKYALNPIKRRGIDSIADYICAIARNQTYNELTSPKPEIVPIYTDLDGDEYRESMISIDPDSDAKIIAEEFMDSLVCAVFSLRPALYKVLRLHWLGYTNEEIGYMFATLKFSVAPELHDGLARGHISKQLYCEFENNKISLSRDVKVTVREKGSRWLLTERDDGEKAFAIMKESGKLSIALIKPKSIASELSKARRNIRDILINKCELPSSDTYEAILESLRSNARFLIKLKSLEDNIELRKKAKIMLKRRNAK